MADLLKNEYVHFGSKDIRSELWLNVQMQKQNFNYSKPIGGLWCSKSNEYGICDWLFYKNDTKEEEYPYYVSNKGSCYIKFKDNSKILSLETRSDYLNLKESGMILKLSQPIKIYGRFDYEYLDEIPNYEKIRDYYDVLYVDPYIDKVFLQYSIETILSLKEEAIEYYKPIEANYINHSIISVGDKKSVIPKSKEYINFVKEIQLLFNNIKYKNYDDMITVLYNLRDSIFNEFSDKKTLEEINITNVKGADKKHLLYVVVNNVCDETIRRECKKLNLKK